ncbi:DNA primase [alpha proteobacterium AAP81b]|nr:DNA primase [alpha proteobacterium AAP81b]
MISPAFLDELRARAPLSPVVARRVKLVRAGREWKGCCPFHNEKTPSFYVNDDKGFYHCFGCGAHGDVISFLTDQEGLPFIDAVKQLAAQVGMEVPALSPRAREVAEQAESLHDILGRAAQWFTTQLGNAGGAAARAYLDRRGVTPALAGDFGLGFAPDARSALKAAFKDVPAETLVDAGLLGRSDEGETYDRFRGRLMFPIRDVRGRVVGFGGRALGDVQPKYLNSADGPLFDKGRLLYNLDKASPAARKAGRIVVVEGYMDVIGVAGVGLAELVAPLGTAMTEAQLQLAWARADEPILCFDGDAAGQRAALRACLRALPLLSPGKSLRIATLPAGEDPDDLVRRGGAPAFEAVLAAAVPLIEHLWRAETQGVDAATPERRAAIRARLKAHSDSIADGSVRSLYAAEIAQRFDDAYLRRPDRFVRRVAAKGKWVPPLAGASAALKARKGDAEVLALLAGLLANPWLADRHGERLAGLSLPPGRHETLLMAILSALAVAPDLESAGLTHQLHKRGLGDVTDDVLKASRLAFSFTRPLAPGQAPVETAARDFGVLVETMAARARIDSELRDISVRFRASLADADFERQQALVAERMAIDQQMMQLAESLRAD